jgi:hypothetical protein
MIKNRQTFSIRETAEILVPDKLGRTSYLIGMVLIVIMGIIITALMTGLPSVVPLYFTLPWGEARLAPKPMLYLLPGLSLAFLIINIVMGRVFRLISTLLPKVLAVSTAVIVVMSLLALLGIIQSLIL